MRKTAATIFSFLIALAIGLGALVLINRVFPGHGRGWLIQTVLAALTLTLFSILTNLFTRPASRDATGED